jgi:hypothetical protein
VAVEVDPSIARSPGVLDSRADIRRIKFDTGWLARFSWEQSLLDLWLGAIERARAGLTDRSLAV